MTSQNSKKSQLGLKKALRPKLARRALALGLLSSGFALAQDPTATSSKKPNILFVIDTSGSMEYITGTDTYPSCYPAQPNPALHTKSRWIEVLEVLTGKIQNYSCAAEDRSDSNFIDEFSMFDGTEPPDAKYRNPYHRPLSNGCAITAERSAAASLSNAFDWAPPVQTPYPVNPTPPLSACATPFGQDPDGFIDTNNDLARFGLMTFDPLPDAQTGYAAGPSYTPQYAGGVEGTWSYYGTVAEGRPADCSTDQILEVGVRNGAAPATEGKMIYFGDQDLSSSLDTARHDRIQQVLLGTRPYGGTPINGALSDARYFFLQESELEPLCDGTASGTTLYGAAQSGLRLSPRFDQYVECGCREQHIILITDGEPNLDLRPHCEQTGAPNGICPFPLKSEQILADLATVETTGACNDSSPGASRHKIETHVVGYSISTYDSGAKPCDSLRSDVSDWNVLGGTCDTTTDEDLKVCCTLHRLANAGNVTDNDDADGDGITDPGVGMPHIAPDAATLRSALSQIMAQISGSSASATRPVRSPGIGLADNTMKAFRLLTSYDPSWAVDGLWYGNIERLRWTCDSGIPTEKPKLVSAGDDFHRNVAENLSTRNFVTFIPDSTGAGGDETLRPYLDAAAPTDGAGVRGGSQVSGDRAAMKSSIIPEALELNYAVDSGCVSTGAADNNTCRNQIVDWTFGYDDGAGNDRCPNPSDEQNCSVIGDILHSTPTIVDRPTAAVEDETYEAFANLAVNKGRRMMAYVSSNDGMLHAFATSPNDSADSSVSTLENNERYAFIPPAVLPRLKSQYPGAGLGTRMQLLDGVAVVQDVVSSGTPTSPLFERTLAAAKGETSSWRTVLVQAFGGQQPGYFALDITDDSSPTFLWQITTNSAGTPIFGTGGQPLITTVNLGGTETAVAVLPGGYGGSPLGGACARSNPTAGSTWADTHFDGDVAFTPRSAVNCYAPGDRAARSLTIVRLDSGQILRRFIRDPSDPADALLLTGVFGQNPTPGDPYLDSPITGAPAAYPAGTGMVADRIFVGDQDGTLWRVDVSKLDADEWTMQLFFDGFRVGDGATAGKPVVVPPVLSVDQRGQITVNFATGDQDLSGSAGENQYVYSLTEAENAAGTGFIAQVNWATRLEDGEHVVGPLSLLDGALYFTTVAPAEQNVCDSAPASIWGVDYLERAAPTANPFSGGVARLQPDTASAPQQFFSVEDLVDPSGGGQHNVGQVFGVSLEYVPSCTTATTFTDQYTGAQRTSPTGGTPPALQLVFQTSGDTDSSGLGFNTSFQAVNLVQNRTASTIRSWAAILD